MKKVTGIGGIFFKCKDPRAIREWYQTYLGFDTDQWGSSFVWRLDEAPELKGFTQWSPFADKTDYFAPSEKDFMINYRVENLQELVQELQAQGITVLDEIQRFEYGLFVHIMDIEGNKIELWQPFTDDEEGDQSDNSDDTDRA
jgi:predicted enzyme related to lactoylglutathione lyase